MVATTGYQAGVEANNTQVSYAAEVVWGTLPAVQFQSIRYMSESLSGTKTRTRPSEILNTGEVSSSVTTQESAGGQVSFALSYGTFDDLMSGALNNDWTATQTIAGIAGDITITSGTNVLSSTLGTKFSGIALGAWVRTLGFTNAANNGIWRVTARADNSHLTLSGPGTIVTETPALTAAQVRASSLVNGTTFKSFYVQQQFASALFLRYPGSYISGMTLNGGVGQFLQGSFTLVCQQESSSITQASTGAVLAAPTGRIHDPIAGFGGAYWNDVAVAAAVDSFTVTVEAQGSAQEFAMGSAMAQGILMGALQCTGSMKLYFKDFTLYAAFKAETLGKLAFVTKDPAGSAYVITVLSAALMNPKIEVGGPGQAVYASFDIEGNPQAGSSGTVQIDRLPAI